MLRTKAHSDYTRGNAAQGGKSLQKPNRKWNSDGPGTPEHAANDLVLNKDLQPLRSAGGKVSSLLNSEKVIAGQGPCRELGR